MAQPLAAVRSRCLAHYAERAARQALIEMEQVAAADKLAWEEAPTLWRCPVCAGKSDEGPRHARCQ